MRAAFDAENKTSVCERRTIEHSNTSVRTHLLLQVHVALLKLRDVRLLVQVEATLLCHHRILTLMLVIGVEVLIVACGWA